LPATARHIKLGGDCYDFVPRADQALAVTVGDASGKGFATALMIPKVQSSLRAAALFNGDDAAALLWIVNQQVYASSLTNRYGTLFYGILMEWLARCATSIPATIRRWPCGARAVLSGWKWKARSNSSLRLIPGLHGRRVEAVNPSGEEWGVEGLLGAADINKLRSMRRRRGQSDFRIDG
jgi:hypothetical protein